MAYVDLLEGWAVKVERFFVALQSTYARLNKRTRGERCGENDISSHSRMRVKEFKRL